MLLHTMPTTMPMAAIFNNKIKSALLILMCALIWQHGPKMCGVDAADNNEDNNNNERGNNAYGMTAAGAALLMSGINDERADSGNGSGRNAAGLQWDKQAEQVAKDQLSEINETLSGYSSDDGDDIKAVEAVAAAAAAAEKEEEEKEEEKNHNDKTAITVDREDKAGKGSNAIGMADELTTTATTTTTEVLMETTSTATTATTTTEVFIETTSTAATTTTTTTTTVLTAALTTDAAANVQDHNEAVNANNNNSNNNNNRNAYERTTITQRAMAKASPAAVPDVIAKAAAAAWPDEAETAEAEAADELDPVPLVMTAILQQQLIYDIAIKYKQIPRVTFLTCRSETAAGAASESVDRTMSLNVNTMEILRRMYTAEPESATKTTRTTTTATTTTTIAKPIITTTATTAGNTTATAAGAATKTASLVPRGNGNGNGNGKGNVIGVADTGTVAAAAIAAPAGISDAATNNKNRNNNINNINSNNNNEAKSRFGQTLPRGILIKVVQIDQLINKRRASNGNSNGNNNGHVQRAAGGPAGFGVAYGRAAGGGMGAAAAGRNAYTNANWLEQVLRADTRRQMVVLNLSCGAASRRLLEMASNKALFNSSYHWLLIEDYAFNRQTGIDDSVSDSDDNDDNDNDNDNTNTNTNASNEEVVNGDKRVPTKKLDIVGAATATNERQRQLKARQQQQQSNAAGMDAAADSAGNEDDMEIIEKFLEKINININTELILAKRQRQRQRREEATDGIGVGVGDSVASNATNSNNSLQKKDYYKLYDVWNPGLQYGGQLNISEIGYFALDDGLQIAPWYRRSTTITRRLDMEMARIRCLVVITHKNRTDTLEHYLTTHYDTHLDSMNRFNFALLSHVRDLFNFSFVLSKTSTWGYLKNGKFDGMIGALVRKQADIGGSPIFFRIERAKVIDYTSRTWVARPCFIFRHPRSTKKDRIVFLQPFSNDVWIWLGVCGVATILLLWLLTTLERRLESAQGLGCLRRGSVAAAKSSADSGALVVATTTTTTTTTTANAVDGSELGNAPQRKLVPGGVCRRRLLRLGNAFCGQAGDDVAQHRVGLFLESVLFYVGSICQQGLAFSTSFFSGRCIVITSLLFAFSIYQFYSASIVGTLLMEKPKTIRTLRDLIHSSLEIGIEDIVYNRDYFLRTKDPDAIELYAKKVTSVPMTGETFAETPGEGMPPLMAQPPSGEQSAAAKAKTYREILHSHETGAHAKTNEASNWYDPEFGVAKIKKGRFAFHVDVATAYKIIADTYNEKEICDLTEIQLFPPQKMVSIVQKGSPLRKIITYGLRRVTEVGLMDYQRKVWHSPKPRCVKQIHTDDLRVDMQTFMSALLVLIFGYAVSLLALSLEIMHHKLWQRYVDGAAAA